MASKFDATPGCQGDSLSSDAEYLDAGELQIRTVYRFMLSEVAQWSFLTDPFQRRGC